MSAGSPDDFPAIHALQGKLAITPLSAYGKPYAPPVTVTVDPNVDLTATPFDQVRLMTCEMFFKRMALAMKVNPPSAEDGWALDKLKLLGVEPGKPFDPSRIDEQLRKGIGEAPWTSGSCSPRVPTR